MRKFILALVIILGLAGSGHAVSSNARDMARFIPTGELNGWYLKGITNYDASNLYLYIDGQAELYIDFGLRDLASAEYGKEGERGYVTCDVYDMGNKDRALGIYSAEKDETAKNVDVGAEGYVSGYILNFWKGSYYVKLAAIGNVKDRQGLLKLIAGGVAERLPGDNDFPERAKILNREGMLPGTIRYSPISFQGHAFITNTFHADYKLGDGEEFKLFISEYKSPEDALSAFRKYRDFVSKDREKKYEELKGFGEVGFFYGDRFGKQYIIIKQKNYLCGATGEKLGDAERGLLKEIIP
ncbi:DUF6599 family protein [Candidatus Auribacterota bacterium]